MVDAHSPVVIEAAVSRPGAGGHQESLYGPSLAGARAALDAGASVIHFHQDLYLTQKEQIAQIIRMHQEILATHPDALIYSAPLLNEQSNWEINAHYPALAKAGCLSMIDIEMGRTLIPGCNDDGLPNSEWVNGHTFSECDELAAFAREHRAPIALGIYNPAMCYWIREYAKRDLLPKGTFVKIWMGGRYKSWSDREPTVPCALKPTIKALDAYLEALEGVGLPWTVAALGDNILETPVARYALEMGGSIRVGEEDVSGTTTLSNAQQVEAAVALAKSVGRQVVSGAEAKKFLGIRQPVVQAA